MAELDKDWEGYIRELPNGLDSFPTYVQKASLVRAFCAGMKMTNLPASLPAVIRDLVDHPPPVNTWVPEVQAQALYLAVYKTHFKSYDEFVARLKQLNRDLVSGTLYRGIFNVASAQEMIRSMPSRWEALHRGIQLRSEASGDSSVIIEVSAPSMLHHELIVRIHVASFEAVFESSGAKNARFQITKRLSGKTIYEGKWD